jgi:hypothetical protein
MIPTSIPIFPITPLWVFLVGIVLTYHAEYHEK